MKTSFIVITLIIMGMNELHQAESSLIDVMSSMLAYDASQQCEDRAANGFICINCEALGVCIQVNDKWEAIPVELCDTSDGFYCNANEGACSNKTGQCNPINGGAFSCTSVGTFPDPYDCQLYHVCYMNGVNIISVDISCDSNWAYNPLTGGCTSSLNDDVCQVYGFSCSRAGDMGPWLHNPNIFYICISDTTPGNEKIIYPQLYRCAPNEVFVIDRCVRKDVTTTPSTTTPALTTTSPNTGPTTSSPTTPADFTCTQAGAFPDVTSCRHYYYCNTNLQARRYECPGGTYFNQIYSQCTVGDC